MENQKNQITLIFLTFFLGIFGIHRFYCKKYFTGLLMMFTFGGLGIWPMIDIIFAITGEFKDSKGIKIKNENFSFKMLLKPAGIFLMISSLICFIAFAITFFYNKKFIDSSIKTTGIVIDLRKNISEGQTHYYPTFKFKNFEDEEFIIHLKLGSNPPSFNFSEEIERQGVILTQMHFCKI